MRILTSRYRVYFTNFFDSFYISLFRLTIISPEATTGEMLARLLSQSDRMENMLSMVSADNSRNNSFKYTMAYFERSNLSPSLPSYPFWIHYLIPFNDAYFLCYFITSLFHYIITPFSMEESTQPTPSDYSYHIMDWHRWGAYIPTDCTDRVSGGVSWLLPISLQVDMYVEAERNFQLSLCLVWATFSVMLN